VGCGTGDDNATTASAALDGGSRADATVDGAPLDRAGSDALPPDAGDDSAPGEAGTPAVTLPSTPLNIGPVNCGSTAMQNLTVGNSGTGPLAVTAASTGTAFSVSPTSLVVDPGGSGTLTVTAAAPGSSVAGTTLTGSIQLFTSDPAHPSVTVPVSATPTGATIIFDTVDGSKTSATFPSTPAGTAATGIYLILQNVGNAPASIVLQPPSDPQFSLSGSSDAGTAVALGPRGTLPTTAGFRPNPGTTTTATASSTVTVSSVNGSALCNTSVGSIAYSGAIGHGQLSGWPAAPIDFGPGACGGTAPAQQLIILTNSGVADVHLTSVTFTRQPTLPGYGTFGIDAHPGSTIPAEGSATFHLTPPAVPAQSPLTTVTGALSIGTDIDTAPHTIDLTEEPSGAVLAFDSSPTAQFGSFGQVVLLQAASQNFNVTNTGNAPARVTLGASGSGSNAAAFTVSSTAFTVPANGTQTDAASFSPMSAGNAAGSISMATSDPVCSPLPGALALTGFGVGGGPSVVPGSVAFASTCGGPAAQPQTFTVSNKGTTNMNWALSPVAGPGAANYTLAANPAPGLLAPGASSAITVTPAQIPSPAVNPSPSAYAATVTITTDVPYDQPHLVSLGETPLGDQLSFSVASLRFGQIPIATSTIVQAFTVVNQANAGSPAANLSFSLSGTGAGAFKLTSIGIQNLGPSGDSDPGGVEFEPASPIPYAATLAITTTDGLCTPLPAPIELSGTGTQAKVAVSASTLTFGTDPSDPNGLVNCGATGSARTFTVSNTGNQQFAITGLSLGQGAASPYVLSGDATTLPATIPIGGSTTITVTPKPIPTMVANPNDPSPFTDTLTVTTNAAQDSPHQVALVMQARGAVIADTPLATDWDFGTLGNGLIGTFSTTITNTGNAAASVTFHGLQNPTVFGLQSDPTVVPANGVTDVVGQFSPPQTNQVWTDQGTLVVTTAQAFCEPLPGSWNNPTIHLSGSSIAGSLPVTVSGSLAFPSTDCGGGAPAAQSITLTNTSNIAYVFTAHLASGAFYTLQNPSTGDASAGIIPGNGVVVLGVTPQAVTPGPDVVAGAAPYADDLVVQFQSQPPSGVTIPVSWTLNGAMLSLPQGAGPNRDSMGNAFYPADTGSGFELPMDNTGTATASIQFGLQPAGAFSFSPAPPIAVQPGIPALPRLVSAGSDAACPALTSGSATFLYSGPVCRPFPLAQVSIQSCTGAL
jgi:hypothetical protein